MTSAKQRGFHLLLTVKNERFFRFAEENFENLLIFPAIYDRIIPRNHFIIPRATRFARIFHLCGAHRKLLSSHYCFHYKGLKHIPQGMCLSLFIATLLLLLRFNLTVVKRIFDKSSNYFISATSALGTDFF